jgi:hypothetical protein
VTKRLGDLVFACILITVTETFVPVLLVRKQLSQVPSKNCAIDSSREQTLLALDISKALLGGGNIEPLLHDFEFVTCIVK